MSTENATTDQTRPAREIAAALMRDHARDVEYLTIHEHLDDRMGDGDHAELADEIRGLIRTADVTIGWPGQTTAQPLDLDAIAAVTAAELATARSEAEHLRVEVAELRTRLGALTAQWSDVYALHTDSVAGVCPTCYRLHDASDPDDDGLVDWPCPTLRALGIQDVAPGGAS